MITGIKGILSFSSPNSSPLYEQKSIESPNKQPISSPTFRDLVLPRRHEISPRSEIFHSYTGRRSSVFETQPEVSIVRNYLAGEIAGYILNRISLLFPLPSPVIRFTNLRPDIGAKKTLIARLIAKTAKQASTPGRLYLA